MSNFTGAAAMDFPISDGAAVVMPVPLPPTKTTTIEGRPSPVLYLTGASSIDFTIAP